MSVSSAPPVIRYCTRCVYPSVAASPLQFDKDGVCSGCRTYAQSTEVDWERRKNQFVALVERYRSKEGSNYDCIIPVSGGKDSYFQIHIIKELGLKPLLVTYHGNNYTPTGMKNLLNMREVFNCDHVFFTPSIQTLKVMNRVGMRLMGDMNWHAHAGIFTYPIQVAVKDNVPLMIWGEHGFMDLGGMHSYNDYVEFTYRYRHEHCLRGYEWEDILKAALEQGEQLTRQDLLPWVYPSDKDIERVGVRGIYISNYFKWDANVHGRMVMDRYGFHEAEEPFERTYRRMSNLDDMHENGIHDYMKYIKFGYGRATDHACKDIRAGKLSRAEAIEIVRRMDPIKPRDLVRWLDYVGWTEDEFDRVADTFRDKRVWVKTASGWIKHNLWD
jgi:N-acetyl sugar amidotransferase